MNSTIITFMFFCYFYVVFVSVHISYKLTSCRSLLIFLDGTKLKKSSRVRGVRMSGLLFYEG